ncbi:hypothetical protein OC834_005850 [Tilletia horrida]|nr:hypothetical protein OC834_005850 [Tilletia horrida]
MNEQGRAGQQCLAFGVPSPLQRGVLDLEGTLDTSTRIGESVGRTQDLLSFLDLALQRNEASATDILKDIEEALKSVYEHKDGQDVSFNKNMAAAIEKAQVQLDCVRERAQKDLDDLHRRTTQEIADVQRQMEQETEEAKKARQEGRSEAVGRVMGLLQRLKDGVVGDVRGLCDMLKSSATETEVRAKAAQSGWLRVQTQLFVSCQPMKQLLWRPRRPQPGE